MRVTWILQEQGLPGPDLHHAFRHPVRVISREYHLISCFSWTDLLLVFLFLKENVKSAQEQNVAPGGEAAQGVPP
jgi:hypothetical protein